MCFIKRKNIKKYSNGPNQMNKQRLLDRIHDLIEQQRLSIRDAIFQQDLESVTTMLQPKSINAHWEDGQTLLIFALSYDTNVDIIDTILKAGANPNTPSRNGHTPLHTAISINNNPEVIQSLLNAGAKVTSTNIHQAAYLGDNDVLKLLLKSWPGEFSLESKDVKGYTAAQIADVNGNYKCFDTLVEAGADYSQCTSDHAKLLVANKRILELEHEITLLPGGREYLDVKRHFEEVSKMGN